MEKSSKKPRCRDWINLLFIYGIDEWQTIGFLIFHSISFIALGILLHTHFSPFLSFLHSIFPSLPTPALRSTAIFAEFLLAVSSLSLLFAAGNILYSSLPLRFLMARRMIAAVPDWSAVQTALDLGCNRGILVNTVALQLKKQGSSGRVVGIDASLKTAIAALHRAAEAGFRKYVTCRDGDSRRLPFAGDHFDVVVSAMHISGIGRNYRERGLVEMVRVLKPGGIGVVWDLEVVPELAGRLAEMGMEEVRVSESVTAYMRRSHMVSFRKPLTTTAAEMARVDWRVDIG